MASWSPPPDERGGAGVIETELLIFAVAIYVHTYPVTIAREVVFDFGGGCLDGKGETERTVLDLANITLPQ